MIYFLRDIGKRPLSAEFQQAVDYAVQHFNLDDIDITISFEELDEHEYGNCDFYDNEIDIAISKDISERDAIRTLFHEMSHARQFISGRLEPGTCLKWLGRTYNETVEELPWEIEAMAQEEKMIKDFYQNV